jgi:hypothetical protein
MKHVYRQILLGILGFGGLGMSGYEDGCPDLNSRALWQGTTLEVAEKAIGVPFKPFFWALGGVVGRHGNYPTQGPNRALNGAPSIYLPGIMVSKIPSFRISLWNRIAPMCINTNAKNANASK